MTRACLFFRFALIASSLFGCATITETRRIELGQVSRQTEFAGYASGGSEAVLTVGEWLEVELLYRSGSDCFDQVTTTTQRKTVIARKAEGSPLILPIVLGAAGLAGVGGALIPSFSQRQTQSQVPVLVSGFALVAVGGVWALVEGVRQLDGEVPAEPLVVVESVARKCDRVPIRARTLKLSAGQQERLVETSDKGRAAIPLSVATDWLTSGNASFHDSETGRTVTPRWLEGGAALVAQRVDSRAAWAQYLALFPDGAQSVNARSRVAEFDRVAAEQRRQVEASAALMRVATLEQAGQFQEAREALSVAAARGVSVEVKDQSLRKAIEARGRGALEHAWQFTKQNKPDEALEALAAARRDGVDEPRLEPIIAALPEMRRRERERREREEREEVQRVLGDVLSIHDDGVIHLTDEAGELLAAIGAGEVAWFARLVDSEAREALESAAGAYQLEQVTARLKADARWVGLLARTRRFLATATFAVRISTPVRWDKPRFVIDFERSELGANGLLAGVVYSGDSLSFSVGNSPRFRCHSAGLPVLFPQRPLYPLDCEFSLAGLPKSLMDKVEDAELVTLEFRWTGLGEGARGTRMDSDFLVRNRALRFETVPVRVMKDVRLEVLDAEGRVLWSAK